MNGKVNHPQWYTENLTADKEQAPGDTKQEVWTSDFLEFK